MSLVSINKMCHLSLYGDINFNLILISLVSVFIGAIWNMHSNGELLSSFRDSYMQDDQWRTILKI